MPRALMFIAGAAAGAAAAYFLDPEGGARRRSMSAEKALQGMEEAAARATAQATKAAGKTQGAVSSAMPSSDLDDITLARKVETMIFRPSDAPKGAVSVNAENGVVFLRGQVDDPGWIDRLGREAEKVGGVKAVRNLLHRAGTPAPHAPGT